MEIGGISTFIAPVSLEEASCGACGQTLRGCGCENTGLTDEEKKKVAELKKTDREVRAHEQAHLAASGGLARGGAHYSYEKGPDGRSYAVGGEVSIDTSEGRTPEETIQKMRRVRAAALAPADPSSQDRQVAASAAAKEARARSELMKDKGGHPASSRMQIDLLA